MTPSLVSPKIQEQSLHHLKFIESLRGLAALYVVLFHVVFIPNPNLSLPSPACPFISGGGTGVALFFIVSAFTLTFSMRQRENQSHPVLRFYIRRIFRIVPLFYILLVISCLRDWFRFGDMHTKKELLLNIIFGFNFVPGKNEGIVWASWTLGVEMIFYLLFPLLYYFVNDSKKALVLFFITLLAAFGFYKLLPYLSLPTAQRESFFHFSLLHHMPVFVLGMMVFFLFEKWILGKPRHRAWAFALIGVATIGFVTLLARQISSQLEGWYWFALAYAGLLLGLAMYPLKVFVNRVTCFYGKISYSLYLNHPTIVLMLIPIYRKIYALNMITTVKYGMCLLFTLALLTPLSYLTYRVIEEPGMDLGRKIIKRVIARAVRQRSPIEEKVKGKRTISRG